MLSDWSERLAISTRLGRRVDLRPHLTDEVLTRDNLGWLGLEDVPAAAVVSALSSLSASQEPSGLRLRAARIRGPLDVTNHTIATPLLLDGCILDEVCARWARWHGLALRNCLLGSALLDDGVVTGDLDLRGSWFSGGLSANGLRVAGRMTAADAGFESDGQFAVSLSTASVQRDVDLTGAWVRGRIKAVNLEVGGSLVLDEGDLGAVTPRAPASPVAEAHRSTGPALSEGDADFDFDGLHASNSLTARGLRSRGLLSAVAAEVDGEVDFHRADLGGRGGTMCLRMHRAQVRGGFSMREVHAQGELSLLSTKVGGQLWLHQAVLCSDGDALSLDGSDIAGLALCKGMVVRGRVRALDTEFGSNVTFEDLVVDAPVDNGAEKPATTAHRRPVDVAMNLQRCRVAGVLRLRGLMARGAVLAEGATIGRDLDLSKAALLPRSGHRIAGTTVLGLSRSTINVVDLCGAYLCGEVNAGGSVIDGMIDLTGAVVTSSGRALALRGARLSTLRFRNTSVEGQIDLRSSEIRTLDFEEAPGATSWQGRLVARGWRVDELHGPPRSDPTIMRDWLQSEPVEQALGGARQPWEVVASVYDNSGRPGAARRIRFAAASWVTQHGPPRTKPVRWVYKGLVGYGYYPSWAAAWLILAVALTVAAFWLGQGAVLVTTDGTSATWKGPTGILDPQPWGYAMDYVIPGPRLAITPTWSVSAESFLAPFLVVMRVLVWALTALLLAAVTGLLPKK